MNKTTLLLTCLLLSYFLHAQNATIPEIELTPFASGFNDPLGIEHAGDERLYVVEQTGMIKFIDGNGVTHDNFLDLGSIIHATGEQGLLGLAFDPDYATNGYFYVHYTNKDQNSEFARFTVDPNDPDHALLNSISPFLEDDDPFSNHNGGQMKFGPDGYLYMSIGDGGSGNDPGNRAQDVTTLEGKILRIDPTDDGLYVIPPGNPYGPENGAHPEIWATGVRNPWRFSFDKNTGDLWIADVGQNVWEEINFQPAGAAGGINYGWSCDEGTHFFKADCDNNGVAFTDPIAEYAHDGNPDFPCSGSVTGGYVYRGSLYPNMFGKYFYVDYCTGVMRTTFWNGTEWITASLGSFDAGAYSTFGEDINGELYLVDQPAGIIYSITDVSVVSAVEEPGNHSPQTLASDIKLSPNPNDGQFAVSFTSAGNDQAQITVENMLGRIVWKGKKEIRKGNNEWSFEQSDLVSGAYILQIQTAEKSATLHFIVQ